MMARLQAEESFVAAERAQVGSGHLRPGQASEVTGRWRRQMAGPMRAQKATPEQLMAMGIGVTFVPPRDAA